MQFTTTKRPGSWACAVATLIVVALGVVVVKPLTIEPTVAFIVGAITMVLVAASCSRERRVQLQPATHASDANPDERFSIVFSSAPVAILLVRVNDGLIVDVNPAFTELSKYTRAEAVGRTSLDLSLWIEPAQLIEQLKRDRHSDVQALQIRRKGGEPRDVLASVTLIQIDGSAHLLITAADVTERERARHLEHIAHHDTLTQLPNRLALARHLADVRERVTASGSVSAMLFLDLDRFKEVNDSLGHQAGDELLRLVAARLQARLRAEDFLARLGGDEFVVVLEDLAHRGEARRVADELIRHVAEPFTLSGGNVARIGVSIGIGYIDGSVGDVETVIQSADAALYAAKHAGRGVARTFERDHADLPVES